MYIHIIYVNEIYFVHNVHNNIMYFNCHDNLPIQGLSPAHLILNQSFVWIGFHKFKQEN